MHTHTEEASHVKPFFQFRTSAGLRERAPFTPPFVTLRRHPAAPPYLLAPIAVWAEDLYLHLKSARSGTSIKRRILKSRARQLQTDTLARCCPLSTLFPPKFTTPRFRCGQSTPFATPSSPRSLHSKTARRWTDICLESTRGGCCLRKQFLGQRVQFSLHRGPTHFAGISLLSG